MGEGLDDSNHSFPSTRWSLVDRVRVGAPDSPAALGALLRRYLPALRSHLVVRRRIDPHLAEDLLQGFTVEKVIENQLVNQATRARGRFRTFLLTALDRYVIDSLRFARADKRGGKEQGADADQLAELPSGGEGPEHAFEIAWAREVLAEAHRRMRDECEQSSRAELWDVFVTRVWGPAMEGVDAVDYQTLVTRHGFRTPAEASNAMTTAKRVFARHLRAVVTEYAGDESETEAEIRDLHEIVSKK